MKPSMHYPEIQIICNEPVPPAEMVADHQYGHPLVIKLTLKVNPVEVPPEHKFRINLKKSDEKWPVLRSDHPFKDL